MRLLVLLLLTLACAPALAAARVSVELLPTADVSGPAPLLGHVARIHGTELALVRRLVLLPLPAATQGGPWTIERAQVLAEIARKLELREDEIAWKGADSARLTWARPRVDAQALAQAAVGSLAGTLQARGIAAEIRVRNMPRSMELRGGGARLQARPVDHLPLRRSMVVWVDVLADEQLPRAVPVTLELTWSFVEAPAPGDPSAGRGQQQASGRWAHVPVVARGDWATLRASAGAIVLESRVEVLQDGQPGDRVRVRSQGAGGIVFARVIGTGQVELAP
jgi:flagella basal body P-ring formation protein FlgA